MMFIDFLKAREGKNKYGMLPQNFNRRKNVAMEHNVLRVYVRWRLEILTLQYSRMFDRGTNVE